MFFVKLALSNLVIVACVLIGRRFPALGGLIATMPLTSLIVLVWLASDNPADPHLLTDYTRGVLWGILPTICFFAVAFLCLRRGGIGLPVVLALAATVWLGGALLHQFLLR
jgi:F0F1-type ATP synthase assembly protein I